MARGSLRGDGRRAHCCPRDDKERSFSLSTGSRGEELHSPSDLGYRTASVRSSCREGRTRMPRVTPAHEREVRDRIVRASLRVFAEKGFDRATMQDVVRASGLSVGAIYTYFRSKDELILAGCDLITDQEVGELRERLAAIDGFR